MGSDIQAINLEDYVQTGEGGTAITYNNKNGKTLAKLFTPGWAADTAAREFRINQVVYESGLPTPQPIRLITDGTRFGAEYELISPKRSFARIISEEPDQLVPLSERFARLTRQIHEKPADTQRLPDIKEIIITWIDKFESLPADLKERFHRFLALVPSSPTCLHGDLHIGNIITDGAMRSGTSSTPRIPRTTSGTTAIWPRPSASYRTPLPTRSSCNSSTKCLGS